MNISVIEDLGFSKREATVYLSLLELGPSTITNIIKKSGVPSSKIYEVLDRLMDKGMVSYVIKGRAKEFQASDPENILGQFEERKERFEEVLPTLKETQRLAKRPHGAEYYEGRRAIFKVLSGLVDAASPGDEYLSFAVGKEHTDHEINRFLTGFSRRRVEKGLTLKVLSYEGNRKDIEGGYSKDLLKIINNRFTSVYYPQGLVILNDKVVLLSWETPASAIVITSKKIANEHKAFFYQLYKEAIA